jgi:glycosyltransferase involved in cell wall biosynthesis
MDKARHTIAHVITESGPFGGSQRNTLLTLKGLVRDGYKTELICGPGGRLIPETEALGVPVHVLPDLVRQVDPRKDCRALLALYRLFRARHYSIVHTHATKAGFLGRLAAWWARVPNIVHTFHSVPFEMNGNLGSRFYIALERLTGRVTHRLACVGDVLRQQLAAWKVAPAEKLVTIYSGIEFTHYVAHYTPTETKRQLGLEEAWPIVGSIGRLCEQKAQHYLVEAVALLRPQYPCLRLVLVGEGGLRPLLERRIHELDLSAHILFLGERDDIADLLNIFDIYAMSSLWEGVGRALTEAMYWKLPVVATPVNGVTELVRQEETGLLVPPRDPRALAAAISRLASDRHFALQLGAKAHDRVKETMDGQRMITAIEDLYERLTGRETFMAGHAPLVEH